MNCFINIFRGLIVNCGCPAVNNSSVRSKNLNLCSCNFLAVRDVNLADFNNGLLICYQNHAVTNLCTCRCNISKFINRKGCISGNSITVRCCGLTKGIGDTCCESFNDMNCFVNIFRGLIVNCGCPAVNNSSVRSKNLNLCSCNFLTVSNINLADLHFC